MKIARGIAAGAGLLLLLLTANLFAAAAPAAEKPSIDLAKASKLDQPQAGYYRYKVGSVDVIALSDGTVGLGLFNGIVANASPQKITALLNHNYQKSPIDASINAFLIKLNGKLILVDVGSAKLVGPTAGKLPDSLRAVGVKPGEITDVFITHIHPDHSGGLVSADGNLVFPNAIVHINKKEADFWLSKANAAGRQEPQKSFFDQAEHKVKPYFDAGKAQTFDGATEFFPGFRSEPTYGHTPGHVLYVLESNGEKLRFLGDLFNIKIQLTDPTLSLRFDTDSAPAIAERGKSLEDMAKNGYLVAPAHMPFPGIGHVGRDGKGYRWVAVDYVNDAVAK
jgi:glyoxylase-like metal-dependent hydrolase (beta-lactamase superfamily II)